MPKWLEKAVFYNIYPQSFQDSNGDGIGDLNGITARLDYIAEMGFNALWLNPIYKSPFRDAGYDVADFYAVAERYGTMADFENLCKKAHEKGIKVIIDLVAGHTALECEWFQKSCLAQKNEYSNRYIWTDDWEKNYEGQCIGGYSERNGMFMKNFFYAQPALNYGFEEIDDPAWQLPPDHPDTVATKEELKNIMRFWIGKGADGYRVDMAPSLIKNDPNRVGIKRFWHEMRAMFDAEFPECVLISEWSDPAVSIDAGFHIDFLLHMNYPGYSSLFRYEKGTSLAGFYTGNSYFRKVGNGSICTFLDDYLPILEKTKGKGYISIPTGNHDLPRLSYKRDKREMEVAETFVLMMPGVPFVYYGDEIGMKYFPELPSKEGGYVRTGSRTPMQWTSGKNAGFSTGEAKDLYLPVEENGVNVEDQLKDENSLLRFVQKLIALRKSSGALSANGEIEFLNQKHGGYPLVFRRFDGKEEYIICINPTDRSDSFEYDFSGCTAVLQNDADIAVTNGKVTLPPTSCVILKKA